MTVEARDAIRRHAFLGAGVESCLEEVLGDTRRVVLLASRSADEGQVARLARSAGREFAAVVRPAVAEIDRAELDRLAEELREIAPDAVVALGGGAIMDAGKALARPRPRLVLVPTTLSGSEHTVNTAWWDGTHKVVVPAGMADAVIADPSLLVDRLDVLAPGALHAFAHVLATLTQTDPDPAPSARQIVTVAAADLVAALVAARTDVQARARFQRGAWNAAVGFGLTGPRIGPHHFLVHKLAGPGEHARSSTRLLCATLLRTDLYSKPLLELDRAYPGLAADVLELARSWAPQVRDAAIEATEEARATAPQEHAAAVEAMLAGIEPS